MFFLLLTIIGSFALFYPYYKLFDSKRKYEKVKAICVSVNESKETFRDSDGEISTATLYFPVLEYYYDSHKYTSSMKSSDSFTNIPVGTEKEIYVNPEDPLDIFIPFVGKLIITTVLGLVFIGAALLVLIVCF